MNLSNLKISDSETYLNLEVDGYEGINQLEFQFYMDASDSFKNKLRFAYKHFKHYHDYVSVFLKFPQVVLLRNQITDYVANTEDSYYQNGFVITREYSDGNFRDIVVFCDCGNIESYFDIFEDVMNGGDSQPHFIIEAPAIPKWNKYFPTKCGKRWYAPLWFDLVKYLFFGEDLWRDTFHVSLKTATEFLQELDIFLANTVEDYCLKHNVDNNYYFDMLKYNNVE